MRENGSTSFSIRGQPYEVKAPPLATARIATMSPIMRRYQIVSDAGLPDALQAQDVPEPSPAHGEVLIRIHACSFNFRDTLIPQGGYPRNRTRPVVPLSDGAGTIEALGPGVTGWQEGDRVMANVVRDWVSGPIHDVVMQTSLGGGVDGVLAEKIVLPAHCLVRIPEHLSFEQAATIPCAGLTAWAALTRAGTKAGDTILLLGTGGVSIFGLQFAKLLGARAIITSSSNDKLEKAKQLGADLTINYAENPDWHKAAKAATGGVGVDNVLEVGGPGTLEKSIKATKPGGTVSMIGTLEMGQKPPAIVLAMLNAQRLQGVYVGSRQEFEQMNKAIEQHKLEPVLDKSFPFSEVQEAYAYFQSQKHTGKVVIQLAS